MARQSNPTARVLKILDFLAENPTDRFGLSELARRLEMNKATCLTVLSTLVEAGYVHQHPTYRDYSVGPSLVGAGHAAMARFAELADLIPSMRDLSDDLSLPVVAITDARDQLVVLLRVDASDPLHGIMRAGAQVPFAPPYGAALLDLSDRASVAAYIDRAVPKLDREQQHRLITSLEVGADRGFYVSSALPAGHELSARYETLVHEARTTDYELYEDLKKARMNELGYLIDHIEPAERYQVGSLACAVPSADNRPPLGLYVPITAPTMLGRQVTEIGQRLIAAASEVANRASGRRQQPTVPSVTHGSLDARQELVVVLRALERIGYDARLAGQVSLRDREDGTLLINPFGVFWSQVRARDIIRINERLEVVESFTEHPHEVNPAVGFHFTVHTHRPANRCVIHSHPPYGTIWAAAGALPRTFDQAAAVAGDNAVVFTEYDGIVDSATKSAKLGRALADADVGVLLNHGVIVGGETSGAALARALAFEERCKRAYQLEAMNRPGIPFPVAASDSLDDALLSYGDRLLAAAAAELMERDPSALQL